MSDSPDSGPSSSTGPERGQDAAWRARRRLAEVFGDVVPDTTADERDPAPRPDEESAGERWLREQVPPHHG